MKRASPIEMSRSAESACFLAVLAIAEACGPSPAPIASPSPLPTSMPSAAPASSSAHVATPSPANDRPIAVIAKILTPSGVAGGWDPSRLWLISYDENGGAVDLVCSARATDDVSEFLQRLANSSPFKDVTIVRSTKNDAGELWAWIKANVPPNGHTTITPATKSGADFGEGNRDPFEVLATAPPLPPSGEIASEFALDQLTLVGTVDSDPAHAMFMDPDEKGWIVKVGDHVGRADAVAACSWRVAEVKSAKVVVTRVDATACSAKPAKQVFELAKKKH
jgi:hypothetical protein